RSGLRLEARALTSGSAPQRSMRSCCRHANDSCYEACASGSPGCVRRAPSRRLPGRTTTPATRRCIWCCLFTQGKREVPADRSLRHTGTMATISARSAADLEVINRLVHDASLDTEALSFDEATGELSLPVVVSVWVSGEGAWFRRQFLGGGYAKRDLMLVLHS